MKRSELRRLSPLTAKTELRRTTALGRSPMARSTLHADSAAHKAAPKRRNTGPTDKVRALVHLRSGGWCEWAGCWLVATDVHHRLNRKHGGRRGDAAVRINQAAWLLDACRLHHDLVTSPKGAARRLARESGWLLHEGEDARSVPVLSRHGFVCLADDGSVSPTDPTEEVTMPVARFRKRPVEVSAVRWDGSNLEEVRDFTEGRFDVLDDEDRANCDDPDSTAQVFDVLHSTWLLVYDGDWIVRGITGEFHAVRGDVFAETYERAA